MDAAEAIGLLKGMRIFVTSRERIKQPEGDALFDKAIATLEAALPVAVGAGEDAELLDWLDAANLKMRMGWKVGKAPAGNVSVTSIIFLGSEPVPIREAIRAAMTPATPAGKGV